MYKLLIKKKTHNRYLYPPIGIILKYAMNIDHKLRLENNNYIIHCQCDKTEFLIHISNYYGISIFKI